MNALPTVYEALEKGKVSEANIEIFKASHAIQQAGWQLAGNIPNHHANI